MQCANLNLCIPGRRGGYGLGSAVVVGFGFVLVQRLRLYFFLFYFIVPETGCGEPAYACELRVGDVWVAVCNGAVELDSGKVPCPGAEVACCGVFGVEGEERGEGGGAGDIGVLGEEIVDLAFGLGG